jgi:hypothetical protein
MCALWAFLAALVMVSSLRWVLPIDEEVFRWMQFHRTCSWIAASLDRSGRARRARFAGWLRSGANRQA